MHDAADMDNIGGSEEDGTMEARVRDGASLSSSCSICLFLVIVAGCAFSSAAEALVKFHDRGKSRSITNYRFVWRVAAAQTALD